MVPVNCVQAFGYPVVVRFGFTVKSTVVKSPTLVDVVPTFVLAPDVLMRSSRRSGNAGAVTVLVQNVTVAPF